MTKKNETTIVSAHEELSKGLDNVNKTVRGLINQFNSSLEQELQQKEAAYMTNPICKEKMTNPICKADNKQIEVVTMYGVFNQMLEHLPEAQNIEDVYIRRNMLINNFRNRVSYLFTNVFANLQANFDNLFSKYYEEFQVTEGQYSYPRFRNQIASVHDVLSNQDYTYLCELSSYGTLVSEVSIVDVSTSLSIMAFNRMSNEVNREVNYRIASGKEISISEYEEYMTKITNISMQFRAEVKLALVTLLNEAENYIDAGDVPGEVGELLNPVCGNTFSVQDFREPLNKQEPKFMRWDY